MQRRAAKGGAPNASSPESCRLQPAEETPGQTAAVAENDRTRDGLAIWKHSNLITHEVSKRDMRLPPPSLQANGSAHSAGAKAGLLRRERSLGQMSRLMTPRRNKKARGKPALFRQISAIRITRRRQRRGPSSSRRCGPTCRADCAGNTAWRVAPCRDAPP